MRGTILVLSILLLVPVTGAWQLPEQPTLESEWVVMDEDGWTHAKWIELRNEGLEPLRQISETEVLVWGDHGDYQLDFQSVLRGAFADGYLVVLEPRLPSYAQLQIVSDFEVKNLQLASSNSVLPTTFEVYGISPSLFNSIPGVWWVEPLLETKARNAVSSSIMEHNSMEGHPLWELGLNGSGVIVGVADSGIELDHGCFRENATSIGEIGMDHRKVVLVNTTIDDGDYAGQSDYRHGTHIAGSVGCDLWHGNAAEGTSPSHGARILFQDIVNESGWSEPSVDWLLAEALANGAVIHSDSWGDDTEAYTLRSAEFDLWHREVPWSQAFIAPGNNPSKFYEPANARNVVAVGGSLTENSSELYSSSSHGPTEEGLRGNFIVAPAVGIMSAAADGNVSSFNDDMRASTGTSMSTPLGASITAVIQQMVQDGWFTDEGFVPSGPMLRALLAMSAESMEGGQQGAETVGHAPDPLQGWGRPNLSNLIDSNSLSSDNIWVHDSYMMDEQARMNLVEDWLTQDGLRPLEQVSNSHWDGGGANGPFLKLGETASFQFGRIAGEDLEVFLSFNQRPFGSSGDNLDIVVTLPNGNEFRSTETYEGTERIRIASDLLGSVESVEIGVVATQIGVGNHSDVLGSDGDMLGFALAVKGVSAGFVTPDLNSGHLAIIDFHDGCQYCEVRLLDIVLEVDGEIVFKRLDGDVLRETDEIILANIGQDFSNVELTMGVGFNGYGYGSQWDFRFIIQDLDISTHYACYNIYTGLFDNSYHSELDCERSGMLWVDPQFGEHDGEEEVMFRITGRAAGLWNGDSVGWWSGYNQHTFSWGDSDGDGYYSSSYESGCQEGVINFYYGNGCRVSTSYGWGNAHTLIDMYPNDATQWIDSDMDGYGDNRTGNNPDLFPTDHNQWSDLDGDGYGDNPIWAPSYYSQGATRGDHCLDSFGTSHYDRYGCPDTDGDGYSDPDENWTVFNGADSCVSEAGVATEVGRMGCPDSDGDGWSDLTDDFPDDPWKWVDSDGDGVDDGDDLWPEDPRRSLAGDTLEPGVVVFTVLTLIAVLAVIFLPKDEDSLF
ncbi:MAG: hypothetical protein CMB65_05510 [Euryarchaeota archaeon]|nr:hypothetical protein [Euryarchaeota archaeon]